MSTDNKLVEMTLSEKGLFQFDTLDKQLAWASSMISRGVVSSTFKTPQQLVVVVQRCLAIGVDPNFGVAHSYVIGGKPAFFGDFPMYLVLRSGFMEWIDEFFVDDNLDRICFENKNIKKPVYAAFCIVKRKGDEKPLESFFTIDEAAKAGLFKNSTWNNYTKDMLMFRTRGRCFRGKFADALGGIEIGEFLEGVDLSDPLKDIDQDFPIPEAEKAIGDSYRIQNAKYRGKQLIDIPLEELAEYREDLLTRKNSKPWEKELAYVIGEYLKMIEPAINA